MGAVISCPGSRPEPDLLAALGTIVRIHRNNPEAGGLAVMRALCAAGAKWADLLPVARWIGHKGWHTPRPVHGGAREQMAILLCGRLDVATPMQLAEMAVIIASRWTPENDARAVAICAEQNVLLDAEHKAEIATLLASVPRA